MWSLYVMEYTMAMTNNTSGRIYRSESKHSITAGGEDKGDTVEAIHRTTELTVFGKTFEVKNYKCSINGGCYAEKEKPVKIQLSICPTYFCGGKCPFCSMAGKKDLSGFLDIARLEKVLKELSDIEAIRGISITGGEPFTDIVLLNEIVEMIFNICGVETEISINTNGSRLYRLFGIKRYDLIDTIHISRHHYDDKKNEAYFGIKVPSGDEIGDMVKNVNDPKLFAFNCLLLADGIGNKEEIVRFLEFAGHTGVPKVGFITPVPVNGYVRENQVPYTDIFDRNDDRFLFTSCYRDFDICRCRDGVYVTGNGKLVEFYGRETAYGYPGYSRGLTFGPDNILKAGFGDDAEVIANL